MVLVFTPIVLCSGLGDSNSGRELADSIAGDGALTAKAFQRAFSISHPTFYRELKKPNTPLRIVKVGKRTLIPNDSARAWWARCRER